MSLFNRIFKKSSKQTAVESTIQAPKNEIVETASPPISLPLPKNHSIAMCQLGVDFQVVLSNVDAIESKEVADLYASLFSEKYGVKTKVSGALDDSSYNLYVYRIDLDTIGEFYEPATDRWIFPLSSLSEAQNFKIEVAIESAEIGSTINASLTHELQINEAFTFLFETTYYQFYKYRSYTLLRHEKQTEKTTIVGRFSNIAACIQFHNKLYIAETNGIIGDRELYQCSLNGTNLVNLHCLSNEKVFRAGHFMSMDSVKEMQIIGDALEITVMRNDGSSIYDYKIIITEKEGAISLEYGY